jgi:hypothetical protein
VLLGSEAARPRNVPFELPDPEEGGARNGGLFSPPAPNAAGLHVWLKMAAGRKVLELDQEARERLKALGYLGQN